MNRILDFLKLFPAVLGAVLALEKAPDTGALPGGSKKDILLGTLGELAKVGETIPVPQVALISSLIDAVVTALKNAGVFTSSAVHGASTP